MKKLTQRDREKIIAAMRNSNEKETKLDWILYIIYFLLLITITWFVFAISPNEYEYFVETIRNIR